MILLLFVTKRRPAQNVRGVSWSCVSIQDMFLTVSATAFDTKTPPLTAALGLFPLNNKQFAVRFRSRPGQSIDWPAAFSLDGERAANYALAKGKVLRPVGYQGSHP